MSAISIYLFLWVAFIFFLVPLSLSSKHRQRWWLRLTLRRWHVDHLLTAQVEAESILERSEIKLSIEEERRLRNTYLKKKLEPFSMDLTSNMMEQKETDMDRAIDNHNDVRVVVEAGSVETSQESKVIEENEQPTLYDELQRGVRDEYIEMEQGQAQTISSVNDNIRPLPETACVDTEGVIYGLPLAGHVNLIDPGTNTTFNYDGHPTTTIMTPKQRTRQVANSCPICLSAFEVGDTLCWASSPSCQHVFHQECMHDWLTAIGRKQFKKLIEKFNRSNLSAPQKKKKNTVDFWTSQVTHFDKPCPCCRQVFMLDDHKQMVEKVESDVSSNDGEEVEQEGNHASFDLVLEQGRVGPDIH